MECEFGIFICKQWELAQAVWQDPIGHWQRIHASLAPHLAYLTPLFIAAIGLVKWWYGREFVVFHEAEKRLGEQIRAVGDIRDYALHMVLRPGPSPMPMVPKRIVKPLRRVLKQPFWQPLQGLPPFVRSAQAQLRSANARLDLIESFERRRLEFIAEQRFAVHMLLGALAATRSQLAGEAQQRESLTSDAFEHLDEALRVPGKEADLDALELRALQARELGHSNGAEQGLKELSERLKHALAGEGPLDDSSRRKLLQDLDRVFERSAQRSARQQFVELRRKVENALQAPDAAHGDRRRELQARLLRAVRYLAEIEHREKGSARNANKLLKHYESHEINTGPLSARGWLDRAHFHHAHAIARACTFSPNGPAARGSIDEARKLYRKILRDLDPKNRSWPVRLRRWLTGADMRDGTNQLRVAAREGLDGLELLLPGSACPACGKELRSLQVDEDDEAPPAANVPAPAPPPAIHSAAGATAQTAP